MKPVLLIIALLVMSSIVSANVAYNQTGTGTNTFSTGAGLFNQAITTDSTALRILGDLKEIPLVADLDGDGTQEIIVIDGDTIRLFQSSTLTIIDSFDFGADERISNIIIFDIDFDGNQEIIFVMEESELAQIIEYNGSVITNQTTHQLSGLTHTDGMFTIQCGEVNECLMVYQPQNDNLAGPDIYATAFSSTTLGSEVALSTGASTTQAFCFPRIRSMPYVQLDGVGPKEYIVNAMRFNNGGDDFMFIWEIDVTGLVVTEDQEKSFDNCELGHGAFEVFSSGAPECGIDNLGRFITAPLVADFDASSGNGLEVVVGIMVDSDEYILCRLGSDFDIDEDHPETFEADGELLSNPFVANVFSDSTLDYCVLGHSSVNQELEVLCGSAQTSRTVLGIPTPTQEFKFATDNLFNVTQTFNDLNIITHSGQHSSQVLSGIDQTEVISAYGVMRFEETSFEGSGFINSMTQIYELPVDDLACIVADVEKVGPVDFVCATNTALYYIDDGSSNQPAKVIDPKFNPCVVDSVIKQNTTLEIIVTVEDQNSELLGQDLVNVNVTVYKNDPNQQNKILQNFTSGTLVPFEFQMNQTGTLEIIEIVGWDVENPDIRDTFTQTFTVGTNGVERGDTECIVDTTPDDNGITGIGNNINETDPDNNLAINGLNAFQNLTGLGGTIGWLVLMVIVSMVIITTKTFMNPDGKNPTAMIAALGIVNVLLLIVGALVGAIGIPIIIVITLLGIVAIGVWFTRTFFSPQSN